MHLMFGLLLNDLHERKRGGTGDNRKPDELHCLMNTLGKYKVNVGNL